MRTLKRILVFILFTMALIGTVGGLKYKKVYAVNYAAVLSEDFESYTTNTTYNSTRVAGNWTFYYGTVSTNAVLSDTKSGQMRWYSTATENYPYADYHFDAATTIDKIEFNYAVSNTNVHFDVQYSTDGTNYTNIERVTPSGTSKTAYSKVLASPLSITNFRVKINDTGTAPAKDNYTFRIDDVVLSVESSAPQIATPANASISGNVLSFDAVDHAVSYNIGYFESEDAESPKKYVNITETSYTFKEQSEDGFNYIKIQTIADGVNYLNSNYAYVGTFTNTTINVKTVTEMVALAGEALPPFTYYDITGVVGTVANANTANFDLTDGVSTIAVFNLKDSKEGTNRPIAQMGFAEGDTIRIKAYKETASGGRLRGYLVSVTHNYGSQFSALNTAASLKVDYTSNMSNAPAESVATMHLPTSSLGNVAANVSHASELGFSNSLFKMISSKNSASNNTFIASSDFRLYYSANGDGGSMTITGQSGIKISKIVITLDGSNNALTKVTGESGDADESVEDLVRTYAFDSPSAYATIQNVNTENKQARITAMTIYYSGSYASSYTINTETVAAEEKPLLSLMFGSRFSNELKGNLDGSGTVVTYGIAYAKTDDLTGAPKSLAEALDAGDSFVHTIEGTPVKVDADGTANESGDYSQIGVSLNHIPETSYATEITAAVYVCVDGEYYLMNTKAYSIKSIALAYRTSDCTGYEEHLGLLGYLASYGD